jgi:hypothetical protein
VIKGDLLAKPNYQFEKRQRDLAKKSKQEEKRRQKLAAKGADDNGDDRAGDGSHTGSSPEAQPSLTSGDAAATNSEGGTKPDL